VALDSDHCRTRAAECARLADAAITKEVKASLLKLKQQWLDYAAEADANAATSAHSSTAADRRSA
jgi:hypothetical protein